MVSESDNEILSVIHNLKNAKENLKRIENDYKDEAVLMNFYSYSAKELINQLENHLDYLLQKEIGNSLSINTVDNLDLWIRIEGRSFEHGRGPINVVGSYLQKLNTAVRHSTNLIKNKYQDLIGVNNFYPSFELAATAKGSLKLGLQNNNFSKVQNADIIEDNLFNVDSSNVELFEERLLRFNRMNEITNQSIEVLFKALASANDEHFISELTREFDEDDVIKLIHYAQELAPSSRSSIDAISFEGESLKSFINLKTDKSTRSVLKKRAQHLKNNKEFVEGTALVRQYSVDSDRPYITLIARPFKTNDRVIEEVELRVGKDIGITESQVYNQLIFISGFLHYNANNQPVRIDLDSIDFDKIEELYGV